MRRAWFIAGAVILLAVVVAATWLLATPGGLRFVLTRVVATAALPVTIEQVDGTLLSSISLREIGFKDDSIEIQIESLETELSLTGLVLGQVKLHALQLQRVIMRQLADSSPATGQVGDDAGMIPEPRLPFALRITDLAASDIDLISSAREVFTISRLHVSEFSFEDALWTVSDLTLSANSISGGGGLSFQAGDRHSTRINFKGIWQLNDKQIQIESLLSGNDARLEISQTFAGAINGEIRGAVLNWATRPQWALTSDFDTADLGALRAGLPREPVKGELRLEGSAGEIAGGGSVAWGEAPAIELEFKLASLPAQIVVRELTLVERGGPARLSFAGELRPGAGYPAINGELEWSRLRWPMAASPEDADVLSARGNFSVAGEQGKYRLDGTAIVGAEAQSGEFSSTGQLDLTTRSPSFEVQGGWQALSLRVQNQDIEVGTGRYRADGMVDAYRFATDFSASAQGQPEFDVSVTGDGNRDTLEIRQLSVLSPAGRLSANGSLALTGAGDFAFKLQAQDLNPGAVRADWPGRLALHAQGRGQLAEGITTADVQITKFDGRLRDQLVSAKGRLLVVQDRFESVELSGTWGGAAAEVRGALGQQLDFNWRVQVPDLALYTAQGSGSILSTGRLSGTREQPDVQVRVDGQALRFAELALQQIEVEGRFDARNRQASTLQAKVTGIVAGERNISALQISASGMAHSHAGSVAIAADENNLSLDFSGAWSQGTWRGDIANTRLRLQEQTWTQGKSSTLVLSRERWQLTETCLQKSSSRICADFSAGSGRIPQVELALTQLPLADLAFLFPPGVLYAGQVSGDATFHAAPGSPRGNASFEITDGRFWQEQDEEQRILVDFQQIIGRARLEDGRLALDLQAIEPGQRELTVELGVPLLDWSLVDGPLAGSVRGNLENLGVLSVLFPDLAELRGRLQTRMKLGGTVREPQWEGFVELSEGQAMVPSLGLKLEKISGRLDALGSQLRGELQVRSGPGVLSLTGETRVKEGSVVGQFSIKGDSFLASDLPEARVLLSPDLMLAVDGRSVGVDGSVKVSEARIAPRDLSTAIQRSPDERIMLDVDSPQRDQGWSVTSRVLVEFSDSVFFDGFGLTARVAGALTVVDTPGTVSTATGELEIVDGTYSAYGRELDIRRGRLLFTGGPLANPGLDIMATRKAGNDIEAGVLVRATLKAPEITLYSNPSMPPSQVLSYLLVGQSFADIGDADRQLVNDTATRLASAGGSLIAQQLGRRFGFEELGIASGSDPEQASLVIGRYLSPRLYASYGVGLFEPLNTLKLRYSLSSKWTVRAESGVNQSVDLEYSLER